VHPAEEGGWAELFPLCHDVAVTVTALRAEGSTSPGRSATRAGAAAAIAFPVGVELGLYQPRHPSRLISRASAPEFGELLGKGPALVVTGSSGGRPGRQIHQIAAECVAGVAIREDGFDSAAAGA